MMEQDRKHTQYEYSTLSNKKKMELASYEGTFLHNRLEVEFGINLYSVFGFYAEVWLHRKKNEVEKVRTFTQLHHLEPYLNDIDIKF